MAYKDRTSTKVKGALLISILQLVRFVPASVVRAVANGINQINYRLNTVSIQTIRKNLRLCYPQKDPGEIEKLLKLFLAHSAYLASEFADAWLADQQTIESKVAKANNLEIIERCLAVDKPVIVAVPHLGNWELLWMWLQIHYPAFGMYRAPKFDQLEDRVLRSRMRFGGQGFAGDRKGIVGLIKNLKQGGVMMMLPDQAPRLGSGIYTPFFGHPAYTMTLLHRLVDKVNGQLIFASCLRQPDGEHFEIDFQPAEFEHLGVDVEVFNLGMNAQIESMVNSCPQQYLWNYKRFKRQADGNSLYEDH